MDKLLLGVVKFRNLVQPSLLPSLKKLANKAQFSAQSRKYEILQLYSIADPDSAPRVFMITCMDSRLCPTSFTQADPGDMFIVRNPGNMMPHSQLFGESTLSERAALELAVLSGVEHVVVCGHSNCKAMTFLHHSQAPEDTATQTPWISSWLKRYAQASITKFEQLEVHAEKLNKVTFSSNSWEQDKMELMFDEEKDLSAVDKLSQIHVLEQMQNLKSYGFVRDKLDEGALQIHGLWFDIGDGEMFMYSKMHKRFIIINEQTLETTFGHLISA